MRQLLSLSVRVFATLSIISMAGAARADTGEIPDNSALQCLQRGSAPLNVQPQDIEIARGRHASYMRVKLDFRAPDQAPAVEIMANTTSGRVYDEVLKYVNQYRLPCLDGKRPVVATQEFHFDPLGGADGKPLHVAEISRDPARACVVMPKGGPEAPMLRGAVIAKVILEARFTGDGQTPPELKVLHSDGRDFEYAVRDFLAQYRMPCRTAGDAPYTFRQNFTFAYDATPAKFSEPVVPLAGFLASVRGIKQQKVFFDFNTMACPFRVRWEQLRPVQTNDARSVGKNDANREEFLSWLRGLELDLGAKKVRALLGESLLLDVPCGTLALTPEPAQ